MTTLTLTEIIEVLEQQNAIVCIKLEHQFLQPGTKLSQILLFGDVSHRIDATLNDDLTLDFEGCQRTGRYCIGYFTVKKLVWEKDSQRTWRPAEQVERKRVYRVLGKNIEHVMEIAYTKLVLEGLVENEPKPEED